jgi:predicted nucleic acid-binding protein
VLDASVAVAWCFEDESNHAADQILDLMVKAEAVVPVTWTVEVSNALLAGERRRRSRPADTARALDLLGSLNIRVDEEAVPEPGQLVSLARSEKLSVYDALYLWVAIRKGLPLATLDGGLKRASRSAGVKLMIG